MRSTNALSWSGKSLRRFKKVSILLMLSGRGNRKGKNKKKWGTIGDEISTGQEVIFRGLIENPGRMVTLGNCPFFPPYVLVTHAKIDTWVFLSRHIKTQFNHQLLYIRHEELTA